MTSGNSSDIANGKWQIGSHIYLIRAILFRGIPTCLLSVCLPACLDISNFQLSSSLTFGKESLSVNHGWTPQRSEALRLHCTAFPFPAPLARVSECHLIMMQVMTTKLCEQGNAQKGPVNSRFGSNYQLL